MIMPKTMKKILNNQPVKIVCYGDSITYGYPSHTLDGTSQVFMPYPKSLEIALRERFNYNEIEVINSGHVGWQSDEGFRNLTENVIDHMPDACILMFGINDCKGSVRGGIPLTLRRYKYFMSKCIEELMLNRIEVILLTPTPASLLRINHFRKAVIEMGKTYNLKVLNMNEKVLEIIEFRGEKIKDILPDGIHFRDDCYVFLSDIIDEYINT